MNPIIKDRGALRGLVGAGAAGLLLSLAGAASAQTYESGSTGELGAFAPIEDVAVELPDNGILNYTTISVPEGVTVTFVRNEENTPVWMLATGDVDVSGTIDVSGHPQTSFTGYSGLHGRGGDPGPGGFQGAHCDSVGNMQGIGPGGGEVTPGGYPGGGASPIANGSTGSSCNTPGTGGTSYAEPQWSVVAGGSGGGSQLFGSQCQAGNGGGGVITVASSGTLTMNGTIAADGATGGSGGGGGAGAIRLIATTILGEGSLFATSEGAGCNGWCHEGCGGAGLIKVEAFDVEGSITTNASPPAFFALPTSAVPFAPNARPVLTIANVEGDLPYGKRGGFFPANFTLPTETELTVELEAENIPVDTVVTVVVNAMGKGRIEATSTPLAGTPQLSTATATVTVPAGTQHGTLEAYIPSIPIDN